jgi:hypothetical protein
MGRLVEGLKMFFEGKEYIKISQALDSKLINIDNISTSIFSKNINIFYYANPDTKKTYYVCGETLQSGYEARMADNFIKDCTIFDSDFLTFHSYALLKVNDRSIDELGFHGTIIVKGCYRDINESLLEKIDCSLKVDENYFKKNNHVCSNGYFTLFGDEDTILTLSDFYILKSYLINLNRNENETTSTDEDKNLFSEAEESPKGYFTSLAIIHTLHKMAGSPSPKKIAEVTQEVGRKVSHQAIRNRLNDQSFKQ